MSSKHTLNTCAECGRELSFKPDGGVPWRRDVVGDAVCLSCATKREGTATNSKHTAGPLEVVWHPRHTTAEIETVTKEFGIDRDKYRHITNAMPMSAGPACEVEIIRDDDGIERHYSAEACATARRLVACYNACAGINPEAVQDMLLALLDVLHQLATDSDLDDLVTAPQKYDTLEALVRNVIDAATG